ncbi:MAG TPA: sigma-70 family RNA polymerase sigma factor [Bdellovibrionales bacterium]|nr:sigma-70 family RNA polymerase sigma factor [Bdellovibrionales bacterium]
MTALHWANKWIQEYGGRLLRYAKKLLGNEELAQEVVQDTFLRFLKMKREDIEDKLPEWLFHVCRNRAIDVMRRKKPGVSIEDAELKDTSSSALELLEGNERVRKMLGEINKLPKAHQEIIRLKFQEGLSYEQIAKVTGLSSSNVGFILSTSLKKVREGLGGYADEKGGRGGKN